MFFTAHVCYYTKFVYPLLLLIRHTHTIMLCSCLAAPDYTCKYPGLQELELPYTVNLLDTKFTAWSLESSMAHSNPVYLCLCTY